MRMRNFFIVSLSAFLISNVIAEEIVIPADKEIIHFQTKIGVVTFLHQMHAGLDITECTTCHHKLQPEDTAVAPCHDCHKHESKKPAKAKTAFHTRCTDCHQYTVDGGDHAGPVRKKCKLCHVKPATE